MTTPPSALEVGASTDAWDGPPPPDGSEVVDALTPTAAGTDEDARR